MRLENIEEALARLKIYVLCDKFYIVQRRDPIKAPVPSFVAKIIIQQLKAEDFVSYELNRNNKKQYIWIFKTQDETSYYIKFVFAYPGVVFISFHEDEEN